MTEDARERGEDPEPPEPPPDGGASDPAGSQERSVRPGASDADASAPTPRIEIDRDPIGIFPNWAALYGTVIGWCFVMIGLLYAFTVLFDFGAR